MRQVRAPARQSVSAWLGQQPCGMPASAHGVFIVEIPAGFQTSPSELAWPSESPEAVHRQTSQSRWQLRVSLTVARSSHQPWPPYRRSPGSPGQTPSKGTFWYNDSTIHTDNCPGRGCPLLLMPQNRASNQHGCQTPPGVLASCAQVSSLDSTPLHFLFLP